MLLWRRDCGNLPRLRPPLIRCECVRSMTSTEFPRRELVFEEQANGSSLLLKRNCSISPGGHVAGVWAACARLARHRHGIRARGSLADIAVRRPRSARARRGVRGPCAARNGLRADRSFDGSTDSRDCGGGPRGPLRDSTRGSRSCGSRRTKATARAYCCARRAGMWKSAATSTPKRARSSRPS